MKDETNLVSDWTSLKKKNLTYKIPYLWVVFGRRVVYFCMSYHKMSYFDGKKMIRILKINKEKKTLCTLSWYNRVDNFQVLSCGQRHWNTDNVFSPTQILRLYLWEWDWSTDLFQSSWLGGIILQTSGIDVWCMVFMLMGCFWFPDWECWGDCFEDLSITQGIRSTQEDYCHHSRCRSCCGSWGWEGWFFCTLISFFFWDKQRGRKPPQMLW